MSGNAETERERICRDGVVNYLEKLGHVVACGPKRLDDPPDYDLTVNGAAYALEASTLEDDEPGNDLKPVTREKRLEKLAERIKRETAAEGTLRYYYWLTYPWTPFKNPRETEETIRQRAVAAIREDAGAGAPTFERQLWSAYERIEGPNPAHRLVAGRERVQLFGVLGDPDVAPQGKPRTRWGDPDNLARIEIIPRIEEIAEKKAAEMVGTPHPWVLALANEHLIVGSSSYRELFASEGNAHGFAEIFIVGRGAVPLLGLFEPAPAKNGSEAQ